MGSGSFSALSTYRASFTIMRPLMNFPRISLGVILVYLGFSRIRLTRWVSVFRTRGSLDRRVKLSLHAPAQMGWRGMEHKRWGKPCIILHQGAARSRGYKHVARGRERACSFAPSLREPPSRMALDLPFIDARRGSRRTMGGVAMC
jgi:hypothetical protein